MAKFLEYLKTGKMLLFLLVLFFCLMLFMALFYTDQFVLAVYKVCLVLVGLCTGAVFDIALFPYAKPHGYLAGNWRTNIRENKKNEADFPILTGLETAFFIACIRRMLFAVSVMFGVCIAL